jgi:hypothetical protein
MRTFIIEMGFPKELHFQDSCCLVLKPVWPARSPFHRYHAYHALCSAMFWILLLKQMEHVLCMPSSRDIWVQSVFTIFLVCFLFCTPGVSKAIAMRRGPSHSGLIFYPNCWLHRGTYPVLIVGHMLVTQKSTWYHMQGWHNPSKPKDQFFTSDSKESRFLFENPVLRSLYVDFPIIWESIPVCYKIVGSELLIQQGPSSHIPSESLSGGWGCLQQTQKGGIFNLSHRDLKWRRWAKTWADSLDGFEPMISRDWPENECTVSW